MADKTSPVAELNAQEAIQWIGASDDKAELQAIIEAEERVTVKGAAERRLTALASQESSGEGEEDDANGDTNSNDSGGPDDAAENATPAAPRAVVYSVNIPNALAGRQYVRATSEDEALEKYKTAAGITRHRNPASVVATELDPDNPTTDPENPVVLFGEPPADQFS